jgi:hypothetical protein
MTAEKRGTGIVAVTCEDIFILGPEAGRTNIPHLEVEKGHIVYCQELPAGVTWVLS